MKRNRLISFKQRLCHLTITLFSFSAVVQAQCPASLTATASTTAAACPSGGAATISTNAPGGTPMIYTIINGPTGAPTGNPQSSNVFNALQAGSYTLVAECSSGTKDTITFNINNGYTPISSINTTVTNNCGSFTQGGTITINSVTGGSTPLQYSVIKSNDPNYPDAMSVYGSATSVNVTQYGTYQVRVKDACNQFYTKTINLQPDLAAVNLGWWDIEKYGCDSITYKATLYEAATNSFLNMNDYLAAGGYILTMYEAGSGCSPVGSPIYNSDTMHSGEFHLPLVSSNNYYYQLISPCGDTTSGCTNVSSKLNQSISFNTRNSGCSGSVSNPLTQSIYEYTIAGLTYPVTILVYNSSNAVIHTESHTNNWDPKLALTGLPLGDYTIKVADACGDTLTTTVSNPSAVMTPLSATVNMYDRGACYNDGITSSSQTQTGTKQVLIELSGDIADYDHAVVSILSGPSNVGIPGSNQTPGSNFWGWSNMLPGNYTIQVATGCDTVVLPLTVDASGLLQQSITATATSSCGGNGTIFSSVNYNAYYTISYVLVDANTMTAIDSNYTGDFSNVAPGNYLVKMKLSSYCANTDYTINSNTVTITNPGSGPQIVKKIGLICEDTNGTPTGSGSAFFQLAGGTPLTMEYKLTTSSTWTLYSNNAAPAEAISGLDTGVIYDVRITSCGVTAATQVAIGTLAPITVVNTANPCNGAPYTLEAPQIVGAAYEWRNPSNAIVSTSYNYPIASYNSSYNGTYTCTIKWGTCLTRVLTAHINAANCGQPLPVSLFSFTARATGKQAQLDWMTVAEQNNKGFGIERSADGSNWTNIHFVPSKATTGFSNQQLVYSYTDRNPLPGLNYYRLKQTDHNGQYAYSNIVFLNFGAKQVTIAPNPVAHQVQVSGLEEHSTIRISNTIGQVLLTVTNQHEAKQTIDMSALSKGVYFITITDADGHSSNHKVIKE